ncbi:hypothetical protein HII31_01190 [Pseudocercospora fuligena]|uniref:Uncharacterized protein n=1 Tax=Pseudocercospora fuligena TaxID=685502 RepID=A0A8H6VML9_9PEZI|nr:hypothetical protein HII31_01190 [Pseudocercospora fuligena]
MKLKFVAKGKLAAVGAAMLASLNKDRYSQRVAALCGRVDRISRSQYCYARGWKRQLPSGTQPEDPESTQQSLHDDLDKGPELSSNDGTASVARTPSAEFSIRPSSDTATPIDPERTPGSPKVPPSPEGLHYNFQIYRMQFEDAQDLLWNRQDHFDEERRARDERLQAGQKVKTVAEIDMDEFQETRRLTRWLIEAEEEYYKAKSALLDAGLQPPGSHIDSGFVDDADDGYRISMERDMILTVDSNRIHRWLRAIPDQTISPEPEDVEEAPPRDIDPWVAKEVDMCDSWSMVADGPRRRWIDKWRALSRGE